jgi:hypothetical protein
MRTISRAGVCVAAVGLAGGILFAAPEPHPTHKDRLVEEREGIRVEYSPGQENLVGPFAKELAAWNREQAERTLRQETDEPEPLPLSARYLRDLRDEVLKQVAAEIGLDAPTALQGRSYDALLSDYELMEQNQRMAAALGMAIAHTTEAAVWTRDEVARRLKEGEPMPGFSIEEASSKAVYNFTISRTQELDAAGQAYQAEMERRGLDHDFSYRTVAPGAVDMAATLQLPVASVPGASNETALPRRPVIRLAEYRNQFADSPAFVLPLPLDKDSEGKTPDELACEAVSALRAIFKNAENRLRYREGRLVLAVLHEATEAGLVERYIGSRDRRWLCEGVANYVAWKIARDRAGVGFAREVYDLDRQLANAAGLQQAIDLRRWPAVEKQTESERNAVISQAHYAFAARAVFELARQNGEAAVPKLLREIGLTPREKVRMATVAQAYRKITGKKLDDLIRAAEKTPVVVVPK